jgi:hypothetical protein
VPTNDILLALLDEACDHRSWHGTNLRGVLRGLPLELAAWRPRHGAHNTLELVVHAACRKYAVRRRLTGARRGSFPLAGSNLWARPVTGTSAEWRDDLRLRADERRRLRAAGAALPPSRWGRRVPGSPFTRGGLVRGAAAHDLYHAGQIQLLKRLAATAR